MRGELAPGSFFLCETENPIEQRTKIAGHQKLIEPLILCSRGLVDVLMGFKHRHHESGKRIEPQPGSNLEFAVSPTDGEQLAAPRKRKKHNNPENRYSLLEPDQKMPKRRIGEAGGVREGPNHSTCDSDE